MNVEEKLLPVTIRTINVDGKRLSKSFVKQIPLGRFWFYKTPDSGKLYAPWKPIEDEEDDFRFRDHQVVCDGEILGYTNIKFDDDDTIAYNLRIDDKKLPYYYHIIWITEGKIKRGYVDKEDIRIANIEFQQIYI